MIKTAVYFEVHRFLFLAIRKPKHLVLSHPDNEYYNVKFNYKKPDK